jgi:hypothetical protein
MERAVTDQELKDRFQQRLGDGEKLLWVGEGRVCAKSIVWLGVAAIVAAVFVTIHMFDAPASELAALIGCDTVLVTMGGIVLLQWKFGGKGKPVLYGYAITDRRVIRERFATYAHPLLRQTKPIWLGSVSVMALQDLSPRLDQHTRGQESIRLMRRKTPTSFDFENMSDAYEAHSILTAAMARAPQFTRYLSKPTLEQIVQDRIEPGEEIRAMQRPNATASIGRGIATFLPHAATFATILIFSSSRRWGEIVPVVITMLTGAAAGIGKALTAPPIYAVTNRRIIVARAPRDEIEFAEIPLSTVKYESSAGADLSIGVFTAVETKFDGISKPKEFLAAIKLGAPQITKAPIASFPKPGRLQKPVLPPNPTEPAEP